MFDIRMANTLLTEWTLLVSTIPNSERKARISVPTAGVLSLPWMVAKTLGKTRSRAMESVMRAAGSNVVWVVATVEESTAMSIT